MGICMKPSQTLHISPYCMHVCMHLVGLGSQCSHRIFQLPGVLEGIPVPFNSLGEAMFSIHGIMECLGIPVPWVVWVKLCIPYMESWSVWVFQSHGWSG